ncbi:MAG: type II toxin-antitoxin system Phd/YefM family antitoxin [Pseudomonadales bacterium]|nr:type II toxin-antitoxin system Phd/YefM family antitoxin [Pseudomonadales bacterium]HJN51875.1 type II toxin-antitoxin system Phd/YefM family antitoxin [Pseudomonadales bacterium]
MKTLSLSEAKMKLSALIDSINVTDEEVMITRNGAPAAVLVSPNEFESWRETIAVKSDADLMAEIKTGLRKLKGKKAALYTLEELIGE